MHRSGRDVGIETTSEEPGVGWGGCWPLRGTRGLPAPHDAQQRAVTPRTHTVEGESVAGDRVLARGQPSAGMGRCRVPVPRAEVTPRQGWVVFWRARDGGGQ